jgi:hypothetical protein
VLRRLLYRPRLPPQFDIHLTAGGMNNLHAKKYTKKEQNMENAHEILKKRNVNRERLEKEAPHLYNGFPVWSYTFMLFTVFNIDFLCYS